ncbi:MAG TPA: hypothetical protein VHX44_05925, partial [Planctomycetota bacterium]|nr:hypothetical protein [Planctomycetota bacterium]
LFGATHGLFFPTFVALALGHGRHDREARMAWIGATDKLGHVLVIPLGLLASQASYATVFLVAAALTACSALTLYRTGAAR